MKVPQSCLTILQPHGLYIVHGILQARILEWVDFPFSRGSSQPRDPTQIGSHIAGNSLPAEPQGKPKNTGLGSLSLLQWIFPTQESNWGLPYCRQILYQSGKPDGKESTCNEGDLGSIPGSGRSPGEGNGNPLQYSCLENSMDREAWQGTVHCKESDTLTPFQNTFLSLQSL